MNNKELIKKLEMIIEELNDGAKNESVPIGFGDDKAFLLSLGEYEKYKDVIPHNDIWWWLRSPGLNTYDAAYVHSTGDVDRYGTYVSSSKYGILPALHLSQKSKIGTEFIYNNRPFTVIDDYLAIASVPISFDKFDDESNDYERSYIRQWLIDWSNNDSANLGHI